ncbi:MAG: type IV secretion system family protein [Gammaproteobacteria bacterium]|nr:type IV secretion system family protein [Gammaproteobacteria bacterium]
MIDVQAVARLAQEVTTLQRSLTTAEAQLTQARAMLQALSGGRGMERLLAGAPRNYLPADWAAMQGILTNASSTYAALGSDARALRSANAVLSDADLGALSVSDRSSIDRHRDQVATAQAVFRSAFQTTSGRFATLQSLIDEIARATDPKAILDLEARIGAEALMLQNEQNKLFALSATERADASALAMQERESVVAGQGRFAARFEPTP